MPKRANDEVAANGTWREKSRVWLPANGVIPPPTRNHHGTRAKRQDEVVEIGCTQLEDRTRLELVEDPDHRIRELGGFDGRNVGYSSPGSAAINYQQHHQLLTASLKIQTDFVAFPNLELADLVRDPADPNRLLFLIWKKGEVFFKDQFVNKGNLYVPPALSTSLVRAVCLPTRIGPSTEPRDLLEKLMKRLCEHVTLSEEDRWLIACFVNATWFADRLKAAPYLWITGPLGSGKSTLLKFLHCVCRRGVVLGDPTRATLYSLPSLLHPTLLIDEGDFDNSRLSADLRRLLRMGSTPGINACRSGQLFETYCAKVISSHQVPQDAALLSRAIHIAMVPTRCCVRPLDAKAMERIAEEFQPIFLRHRCVNYQRVRGEPPIYVDHRDLTPRMRDHLGSLSGPLVCDPFLIQKLMGILKKVNEDAHIDRSMEPEWVVLEAVLVLMHNGRRLSSVLAGQIASLITNVLRRRGETQAMSPRSVGAVLKSIGIKTTRVGSRGRGVILTNRRCEEIHAFAHRFELRWTDIAETAQAVGLSAASCKLCLESGLTEGIRADRIEPSECT